MFTGNVLYRLNGEAVQNINFLKTLKQTVLLQFIKKKDALDVSLCGCRKRFNGQQILLVFFENWRKSLDSRSSGVVVSMNLSREFDILN